MTASRSSRTGPGHAARPRTGRRRRYLFGSAIALLAVVIGVGAGVQLSRSAPAASFRTTMPGVVRLAGSAPSLPWPTAGSAALAMVGVGTLGHTGSSRPAPIASITKVMTAYVVLNDHPIAPDATGPDIPVTAATVAAYQAGLQTQQSVVRVTVGETLTEVEALEGLLIPSGNDIAVMLADWDAGSTTAFVAKMNAAAQSLGLDATHFDDVSGLDPGSVSTPADLIRLGEAAMAIPAFARVASMGEATLPVAGRVINFDYALGHDGIVGIKTGSDSAAGGCFLFEARRSVDGTMVSFVGAVLGQGTSSPITAALDAAENLAQAAFAAVTPNPVVPAGLLAGRIVAPWGASVEVRAAQPPTILGWPGLSVPAHAVVGTLPPVIARGSRIGVLDVDLDGRKVGVVLRASNPLPGPSLFWRLTRL
jgi:serine-type D-Ala-D-Ala carboxypeptidase (penicillin-binding protein 5/6)